MSPLLPRTAADRVAWGGVAAGAGVLVAALAQYWGANPGHADRFLILVGAAWAAYSLAPTLAALPARPRPLLGIPPVVAAAVAFPVGVFLLVQIGPRTLLLWWLAVALVAAAGGLALARAGWPRTRAVAFPLLFPLFALPIPLRVLTPLQDVLQDVTTSLSYSALSALGMAVTREEFVLALPGGMLRVEEACSGVRSVTALTAIAAFVAFLRGFGPARGVLLVGLAVPVVAAVNVLRVVLSGLIQEWVGPAYIQGNWHEALGFAMVLVGLVLVLGVARLIGGKGVDSVPVSLPSSAPGEGLGAEPNPPAPFPEREGGGRALAAWLPSAVIVVAVAATATLAFLGRTAEEHAAETAPIDDVAMSLGGWTGTTLPTPTVVTDQLAPDQLIYRAYHNNTGSHVEVWVMHWSPGAAIKGYHHPDICWRNKGYAPAARWVEPVPAGGGEVAVTARDFRRDRERLFVLYWTQEGRRVWTDADEQAAAHDVFTSSWAGHRWVGERLGATGSGGPRLTVVVVAPSSEWSAERTKREAVGLTRLVAADLYRVCPWAAPARE